MKQGSENRAIQDSERKRVFHHLKLADLLLIVLPMAFVVLSLLVLTLSIKDDSLMMGPAIAVASIILSVLFCAVYGSLSLILSLLTRRNITFRVSLAGSLLSMAGAVILLLRSL